MELLSSRARARDTIANTISTVVALPVAYELLFRGAFQRVIARRYSGTTALFIGALGYAASASLSYESLFYRTVAAGLAFGLIYAEAGVYAAVLAHVLYAAHLIL
jgi:membrane protease YdiL (CAAX protease family)